MGFESCFPVWKRPDQEQQKRIRDSLMTRHVEKGTVIPYEICKSILEQLSYSISRMACLGLAPTA